MSLYSSQISHHFTPGNIIPKAELISLLRMLYPEAKQATLNWHIYNLVQQGLLARHGRGRYQMVDRKAHKLAFMPDIPKELLYLGKKLKRDFPLLSHCLWATSTLYPFMQQQPFMNYWLVETAKEAVDLILDYIQANQSRTAAQKFPAIRADDLLLMERYRLDTTTLLLVKPLISEAPVQQTTDGLIVPTAEKILVDLLADTDAFDMFTEELPELFVKLNDRYLLNYDRLRRYARRRNKLSLVNDHLTTIAA